MSDCISHAYYVILSAAVMQNYDNNKFITIATVNPKSDLTVQTQILGH